MSAARFACRRSGGPRSQWEAAGRGTPPTRAPRGVRCPRSAELFPRTALPRGRRMGSRRTLPLVRRQRRQIPPFCPSVAVPRAAPHGPAPHTSSKRSQIAAGSWKRAAVNRAAVNRAAAPWASAKTAEIRVCSKCAYCRGITHAYMRRFPRRLTRTPLLAAARGDAREPWVSFGVSSCPRRGALSRARAPRCAPAPCAAPGAEQSAAPRLEGPRAVSCRARSAAAR